MHAASLILGLVFATQFVFGLPAAVEGGMDKRFNGGNADLAAMVAYGGSALSSREPTEAEIANRAMYRRISGTGGS
ncbi:hypothetical protein DL98DRAFT_585830 [Cadophora sp. DSE1049]|nr:hypothetical protein DL98DRAFT_585830 [Cadophora sp. DSE1049]